MRIFIVGAGGFIGSSLFRFLTETNHTVIGYIQHKDGDITSASIPDDINIIVNAAGLLGTPNVSKTQLTLANTDLPLMLGEHCVKNGIHLIHISTPGVTGLKVNSKESDILAPWGIYERTKADAETGLSKQFSAKSELLTILRPDFVYGPGDRHKLQLFRQVVKGWFPLIGMTGGKLRPTFVTDVCRAIEMSLPGEPLNGGLYNIGGPDVVTVRELVQIIFRDLKKPVKVLSMPKILYKAALYLGPLKPRSLSKSRFHLFGEDHYISVDLASLMGFKAETGITAGIQKTIEWYQDEGLLK